MKFQIGDVFVVNGIESEVVYTNHGDAWFAPVADEELPNGHKLLKNCVFAKADSKGRLVDGSRIFGITRLGGAV